MYSVLSDHLHPIADTAKKLLEERFDKIKLVGFETSIDKSISWKPTILWKDSYGFIACEVSDRPFGPILEIAHSQILKHGIPVRIFTAYPTDNDFRSSEITRDINFAKSNAIGIINVNDDDTGDIIRNALSVPLYISSVDFSTLVKKLKGDAKGAFDTYMGGDPTHGVQELGQIVENIIRNLATDAKKKGVLTGSVNPDKDPQSKIIESLMNSNVIKNGVLGRCRGYAEDRNAVSHKPRGVKQIQEQQKRLKENFQMGIRILEELPSAIKEKGFRLKI